MCKINGRKLGELRVKAGMSQRELAKLSGVSQNAIYNYENGKYNPSDATLEKICMVLKITKDDIEIHNVEYSFTSGESKTVNNLRKKLGSRRYVTPIELEKLISEKRTVSSEKEKTIVKNSIGKATMKVGNKRYILIDPTLIHIPDWQRDTDMAKVEEIRKNFDEDKLDPIKAYLNNDGYLDVADGAHRLTAIILMNMELPEADREYILVELLTCNKNSAVLTFLDQGTGRKPMSVGDTYRAGIKANIEDYIDFKYIFTSHNIQITTDLNKLDNPIGKVSPSRNLLRLSKNKREILENTLKLIEDLDWCGSGKNAFVLRTINTLIKLFSAYGYENTKEKLLTNCKGAVYYESKVFPIKSNAELYDMLAEEINK